MTSEFFELSLDECENVAGGTGGTDSDAPPEDSAGDNRIGNIVVSGG